MGTSDVVDVVSCTPMSAERPSCTDSKHTIALGCWQVDVISYPWRISIQ